MRLHTALLPALLTLALMTVLVAPMAASDETMTRSFSLDDMLDPVHDFPTSFLPDDHAARSTPAPSQSDQQQMEAFVRHTFEPGMAELILAQCTFHKPVLSVTGSQALIDHVAEVLAHLRRERETEIDSHLEVVLMDPKLRQQRYALPELDWKDLPGSPGLAYAQLSRAQRTALAARWQAQAGIGNVLSPSITCFSGQLANCSYKTAYGYPRLDFTPRGPAVGMGLINFGRTMSLRATATDDHRFIHMFMAYDTSSLLALTSVAVGVKPDGTPLTVEEPQVWSTHEQIDQEIADGDSLILTTGMFLEKDQPPRAGFLVLTTQVNVPPATPAAAPAGPPGMMIIPNPQAALAVPGAPAPQPAHQGTF